VSGSCTDQAGNVGSASFPLKYDATPPTVNSATPDRQPDAGGFYNHKVTITFAGSDSTSGIASCDVVAYSKPDSDAAKVSGVCRDNAGNTSAPSTFAFKYDSTPPKLTDLTATPQNGQVTLVWKPSTDVATVVVTRSVDAGAPKTVYSGKRTGTFVDMGLKNGDRYGYTVTATDLAGNATTLKATAQPSAPLIAPREEQRVRGSVTLRWRPVAHSRYYNIQLWYRGAKVLSVWPSGTSYRVSSSWTYGGRAYRLAPGRYVWFIWPGRGAKAARAFGPLLGSSAFVVTG
jgi:hypothetical protein